MLDRFLTLMVESLKKMNGSITGQIKKEIQIEYKDYWKEGSLI